MTQKMKMAIAAAAFVLFIAGAFFAYNALSGGNGAGITLQEMPGSIPEARQESGAADNSPEPALEKAPDFTVEDIDGGSVKLSDMLGKPVVLNFWASWCPPCVGEMPDFDSVYAELGGEVAFMMVNLSDGQRETKEKGAAFVTEQGFSFPVYYDTEQDAAYAYQVSAIPMTVFIDSEGYIVTGAKGQLNEEVLRYGISLIYTGKPGAENEEVKAEYRKITPDEARDIMSETDEYILLDVRTEQEYQELHIPGAVLIPDTELKDRAAAELPDKDALILVYCRSGRRSALSASELADMGYTNVSDFGGIIDWPFATTG